MRHALPLRWLHWIMAGGFVFMWGCGFSMVNLVPEDTPLQETLFALHISIGAQEGLQGSAWGALRRAQAADARCTHHSQGENQWRI